MIGKEMLAALGLYVAILSSGCCAQPAITAAAITRMMSIMVFIRFTIRLSPRSAGVYITIPAGFIFWKIKKERGTPAAQLRSEIYMRIRNKDSYGDLSQACCRLIH